jgi:hypothetical protein
MSVMVNPPVFWACLGLAGKRIRIFYYKSLGLRASTVTPACYNITMLYKKDCAKRLLKSTRAR